MERVTSNLRLSRSSSLGDLSFLDTPCVVVDWILDQLFDSVIKECEGNMGNTRQCHHCHRPTSHPDHVGIGSGVNYCTLEHYEVCPGGRATGPNWTGCPATSSGDEDDDKQQIASHDRNSAGAAALATSLLVMSGSTNKVELDPTALANSLLSITKQQQLIELEDGDDESTDYEEEEILLSEIEQLKIQVKKDENEQAEQVLAKAKADRKEQKRLRRVELEEEKAELIRMTKNKQKVSAPSSFQSVQPKTQTSANHLQKKAAELASRQQQESADRQRKNRGGVDQLTIGGIRSLPGITDDADRILAGLQALIPSLAKTPSAPSTSGKTFQPGGVCASQMQDGDEFDSDFVFHPGRGKFVRVVHSPTRSGSDHLHQKNKATGEKQVKYKTDDETSADEDCPLEPQKGYQLVWKRDNQGEKYFVKRRLQHPSPDLVSTYVFDESSGRYYKREVTMSGAKRKSAVRDSSSGDKFSTTPSYVDHRQTGSSPVPVMRRGVRTPVPSDRLPLGDRVPGIVPIESDKQGRSDKVPDRIQWAKNCPVNWTNKVNATNINLVLWAWSFVAEILATRTGMSPNLEKGELEARLQHLCHVLEITMQTSNLTEFSGDAWSVARLYDQKVQQKVDSRFFSWVQLAEINHGASLPHELIAATQELARKPRGTGAGKSGEERGEGKGKSSGKERKKSTWKCPSWNISETRGKCRFEIENAPEKCNRVHECIWCKTKGLTPLDHQRSFCRRRLAEEEG